MPKLAKLAEEYGDRVGFIGLVNDFASNQDGARKIVDDAGVPRSFIMINARDASVKELLDAVSSGFTPTTILITKDNHSPEKLIGSKDYAKLIDELLT
jgi:thiol-disulfide isomerase/thioredoxin